MTLNKTITLAILAAALIALSPLPVAAQEGDHAGHESGMGDHAAHDHSGHDMQADMPEDTMPAQAPDAGGEPAITAKVKGMVCDFCARAVEKVFGREDGVRSVAVDLDASTINIALEQGAELSDARIAELVKKSGYALVSIDRGAVS